MNLDEAVRELRHAVPTDDATPGNGVRHRRARQVVIRHCLSAMEAAPHGETTLGAVARLATTAPSRPARRACAALMVHALAIPGLVPAAASGDVCALVEAALRDVLLRCDYPSGGTHDEKMLVLQRLHARLDELMQPLGPTFPNWPGLYAG